jgi:hypothetical protein
LKGCVTKKSRPILTHHFRIYFEKTAKSHLRLPVSSQAIHWRISQTRNCGANLSATTFILFVVTQRALGSNITKIWFIFSEDKLRGFKCLTMSNNRRVRTKRCHLNRHIPFPGFKNLTSITSILKCSSSSNL